MQAVEHLGGETHLHLLLSSSETVTMKTNGESAAIPEEEVRFQFALAHTHVFDVAGDTMPNVAPALTHEKGI